MPLERERWGLLSHRVEGDLGFPSLLVRMVQVPSPVRVPRLLLLGLSSRAVCALSASAQGLLGRLCLLARCFKFSFCLLPCLFQFGFCCAAFCFFCSLFLGCFSRCLLFSLEAFCFRSKRFLGILRFLACGLKICFGLLLGLRSSSAAARRRASSSSGLLLLLLVRREFALPLQRRFVPLFRL